MNAVFALGPGRWGGLAGLFFAAGVILIGRHLAARRRPTLKARVVPYLVDTVGFTRLRQREVSDPAGVVAVLGRPLVRDGARLVERLLGGAESVRSRLVRAGRVPDVDRFRAEQVLAGAIAAVLGGVGGLVMMLSGNGGVMMLLWLTILGAAGGVIGWDQWLSMQAKVPSVPLSASVACRTVSWRRNWVDALPMPAPARTSRARSVAWPNAPA